MCPIKFLWLSKCFARAFLSLFYIIIVTILALPPTANCAVSYAWRKFGRRSFLFSVANSVFIKKVVSEGTFGLGNLGTLIVKNSVITITSKGPYDTIRRPLFLKAKIIFTQRTMNQQMELATTAYNGATLHTIMDCSFLVVLLLNINKARSFMHES